MLRMYGSVELEEQPERCVDLVELGPADMTHESAEPLRCHGVESPPIKAAGRSNHLATAGDGGLILELFASDGMDY